MKNEDIISRAIERYETLSFRLIELEGVAKGLREEADFQRSSMATHQLNLSQITSQLGHYEEKDGAIFAPDRYGALAEVERTRPLIFDIANCKKAIERIQAKQSENTAKVAPLRILVENCRKALSKRGFKG